MSVRCCQTLRPEGVTNKDEYGNEGGTRCGAVRVSALANQKRGKKEGKSVNSTSRRRSPPIVLYHRHVRNLETIRWVDTRLVHLPTRRNSLHDNHGGRISHSACSSQFLALGRESRRQRAIPRM